MGRSPNGSTAQFGAPEAWRGQCYGQIVSIPGFSIRSDAEIGHRARFPQNGQSDEETGDAISESNDRGES